MLKSVAAAGGGSGSSGIISPEQLVTVSGTSRTLGASDNGKILNCTNAAATTITCATGLGLGFSVTIFQMAAGKVTVAPGAALLFSPVPNGFSTMTQYGSIGVISNLTADSFTMVGNIGI